jgi:hypothetical protein
LDGTFAVTGAGIELVEGTVVTMREGNSLELGVDRSGLEWLVNHSFYRHGCEAVEGDVT